MSHSAIMSPGTYLRKRRHAAGQTISQLVASLVALAATRPTSADDRGRLALKLQEAEMDRDYLQPGQTALLAQVIRLDDEVYNQLVCLHVSPIGSGLPEPQICRECGCTWHDACLIPTSSGPLSSRSAVPCAWSEGDAHLCTACAPVTSHPSSLHPVSGAVHAPRAQAGVPA